MQSGWILLAELGSDLDGEGILAEYMYVCMCVGYTVQMFQDVMCFPTLSPDRTFLLDISAKPHITFNSNHF